MDKTLIVETPSGKLVNLLDHDYDITIEEIVNGMANINRFNGRGHTKVSVLQHTVAMYLGAIGLLGSISKSLGKSILMHDSAEVLIGDIITPVKKGIPELRALDNHVTGVIFNKFGISPMSGFVKHVDTLAQHSEYKLYVAASTDIYKRNRDAYHFALDFTNPVIEQAISIMDATQQEVQTMGRDDLVNYVLQIMK